MPSEVMRARSWSTVMWFWLATCATDCCSSSSEMRMPESAARSTCRRVMIRRSSTCFSSTSRGGSWPPCWAANWAVTLAIARSSSLRRITPSFTTATMLSTLLVGSACACAGRAGSPARATANRAGKIGFIGSGTQWRARGRGRSAGIAKNSIIEQTARVAAEAAQSVQFDLEVQAEVLAGVETADVLAAEQAHRHAAALPLQAAQRLDGLVVVQRIVPASVQVPVAVERYNKTEVGLFQRRRDQRGTAVAVGQVHHRALVQVHLRVHRGQVGAAP